MELKAKSALFPTRVPLDADVPECPVSHLCGSSCPDWYHDKLLSHLGNMEIETKVFPLGRLIQKLL